MRINYSELHALSQEGSLFFFFSKKLVTHKLADLFPVPLLDTHHLRSRNEFGLQMRKLDLGRACRSFKSYLTNVGLARDLKHELFLISNSS